MPNGIVAVDPSTLGYSSNLSCSVGFHKPGSGKSGTRFTVGMGSGVNVGVGAGVSVGACVVGAAVAGKTGISVDI